MRSIIAGAIALGFLAAAMPAAAAQVKDHPAVKAYTGSVATRRDDDGFKTYSFVTGVNEKGKTDAEILQTLKVDGKVTRLAYENPKDRSAHEIYSNYREGLEKGGFKILFACAEKECGPSYASSRWGRVTGMRYYSSEQRYIVAKATKDGQDIYAAILVAKLRHQVEIVEVTQMEKGLVTAQAIGEGLMTEGRVVLDGILFDTDKATIKAESKPALDTIAQYLKDSPKLSVFIVGHTDGTGGFDHNMTLSKARAASVATALAKTYGIDAKRLGSYGVGPLSPRKTNDDEGGRAENRRVEMVQR
jgi:outer membrane protein OmpA-like peptidoglycan-associated protein